MSTNLELARELVKECQQSKRKDLDLGNCGIADLNDLPELFDCVHLEALNLSNRWPERKNGTVKWLDSVNEGRPNCFNQIPEAILQLKTLKKLIICNAEGETPLTSCDFLGGFNNLDFLCVHGQNISDLGFLSSLKNLQYLDLEKNQIKNGDNIAGLTKIQFLYLGHNTISNGNFIKSLLDIVELDIHKNTVKSLPIEDLKSLRYLNLSRNYLSGIDISENAPRIECLDVSNNNLYEIAFLKYLKSLQRLNISYNSIRGSKILTELVNLTDLDLERCHVSDVSFLKSLPRLRSLNLSENYRANFFSLAKIVDLESLSLRRNEISDIGFLKNLVKLQSLDLCDNKITNISSLQGLKQLRVLKLQYNKISDTSCLAKHVELESLDVHYNQIKQIDFLKKLTRLKFVNVSQNQISNVKSLSALKELRFLDISINEISNAAALRHLTELKTLNIGRNEISDFSFLKNLVKLRILNLNRSKVSDLHFLGNLKNLRSLDLGHNYIKKIPPFIFHLGLNVVVDSEKNDGLLLIDNSIESPPLEIVKQGNQSALDWFAATKKSLNEIKIILIGDPKAGKTSLLRCLKGDEFDPNEVQTDGINIEDIHFRDCYTFNNQKALHGILGHFWDFGGQEIMNATHQFFLTNRSVYLLILDARKDANVSSQIRYWAKRVKATSGKSPIIVIANQIDVNTAFGFTNEVEIQEEFPEIKYFIKTSCRNGEGIDSIRQILEELIPNAELFKTSIDERWIHIKEQLQEETKSKHFLDEKRFIDICDKHGLTEKSARINAINFLNDLGLVLHFEDLNLAEYYVLDPYWITYGVYQIVTSTYAGREKGIVNMDKLEYIVNEEEDKKSVYQPAKFRKIIYNSPNQRRFLVDILNQFKLCFYLPNHRKFIIPDLLDTAEPVDITEQIRNAPACIRFVYKYDYLPNSIMPFIMVESHSQIQKMWRTGCVIEDDSCKALISTYQDVLTIIVTGENKRKREFMAIVRHLINGINQKLSDKPNMLIPLPEIIPPAYAEYEVLLNREKKGLRDYIFDRDKPTEMSFEISQLLEGIAGDEEMMQINERLRNLETLVININLKLDQHYKFLIEKLDDNEINKKLLNAIKEFNSIQTDDLKREILERISDGFALFSGDMDARFEAIYHDLKKTDDLEMKLRLSIPLIKLLGVDFGVEWDVKSWASKMYEKYKLKIFELMA